LNGANSYRSLVAYTGGSGTIGIWDGTITAIGSTYIRCDAAGATFLIGASAEDTISSTSCALALRGAGTNIISSTLSLGTTSSVWKDDTGVAIIRSTGNTWGDTTASQGILKLGCSDALPVTGTLAVGKGSASAAAIFDLNGYTQTVSRLYDNHFSGGTQRITSALPATLIVSNTVDSSFIKEASVIDGMLSLVKANTGTLTLATTNAFSGSLTVLGGTNVISATGSLGINCTNVTISAGTLKLQSGTSISDTAVVTIADGGGAKMELEGVEETVLWLNFGDKPKLPGRYSATAGAGIIVDTVHFAGTGVLNVLKGYGGTVISFR
jgi:autotransporter-associated beta strand protein